MRNSDLLEQLQQKDVTYVYNLSGHNVLNSLINLKQLTFEVTDACNLKCKYCGYGDFYETHGKREDKFLQFDVAKRLIDYLYDIWTNHQAASSPHKIVFGFYGGEPLMNMSLIEQIVAYLESLPTIPGVKYGYAMTTNGMLLDRYMSFLAEKEVMLLLSLDGDEYAQGYRVDHRGANSFQRVFHNMKLLQSTYPEYFAEHVSFNSVIHDKNNDVEVLKFIIEHFNKRPRLAELNNFGISEAKKEEFRKMFRSAQTTELSCADSDFLYASSDVMDLLRLIDRLTDNVYYQYNSLLKKKCKYNISYRNVSAISKKRYFSQ
ncbi:radical SAM peptide maturase [Bacteroides thetaiotaomicron]|uniref:radical SAM peptide maturase n=1 Tax=Bacteroides thetaiotaomicron TaxID=818 RepID=UPI0039C05D29